MTALSLCVQGEVYFKAIFWCRSKCLDFSVRNSVVAGIMSVKKRKKTWHSVSGMVIFQSSVLKWRNGHCLTVKKLGLNIMKQRICIPVASCAPTVCTCVQALCWGQEIPSTPSSLSGQHFRLSIQKILLVLKLLSLLYMKTHLLTALWRCLLVIKTDDRENIFLSSVIFTSCKLKNLV